LGIKQDSIKIKSKISQNQNLNSKKNFSYKGAYIDIIISFNPSDVKSFIESQPFFKPTVIKSLDFLRYSYAFKNNTSITLLFDLSRFYGSGMNELIEQLDRFEIRSILLFGVCGAFSNNFQLRDLVFPTHIIEKFHTIEIQNEFSKICLSDKDETSKILPIITLDSTLSATKDEISKTSTQYSSFIVDLETKYIAKFVKSNPKIKSYFAFEVHDLLHSSTSSLGKTDFSTYSISNLSKILKIYFKSQESEELIDRYKLLKENKLKCISDKSVLLDRVNSFLKNNSDERIIVGIAGYSGTGKTHIISRELQKSFKKERNCISLEGDGFVMPFDERVLSNDFPKGYFYTEKLYKALKAFKNSTSIYYPLFDRTIKRTPKVDSELAHSYIPKNKSDFIEVPKDMAKNVVKMSRYLDSKIVFDTNTLELHEEIPTKHRNMLLIDLAYLYAIPEVLDLIDLKIFTWASEKTRLNNLINAGKNKERFLNLGENEIREKFRFWKKYHDPHIAKSMNNADIIFINENNVQ
jgi:uridine kinase